MMKKAAGELRTLLPTWRCGDKELDAAGPKEAHWLEGKQKAVAP